MSGDLGTRRLPAQPGEVIDRGTTFTFTWNGKKYTAAAGDTIISALMAHGVTIYTRSFKYHRYRGVMSNNYWDPGCFVQIGDEPNVRAAHRKVAAGMKITPQNVMPSLDFDVKAVNGTIGRFLTAGFYYKTFIKPTKLWPTYEKVLSKFAAGGKVAPNGTQHDHHAYDKRYAHVDVLVAGAGPAGMAAAIEAAKAGANVMLVEEDHHTGGHLRYGTADELAILAGLRAEVAAQPNIEVLTDSVVTGRYDHNWIAVFQRSHPHVVERLIKVRATSFVVAPGLLERPYVFEGNDIPGVMFGSAVRKFIALHAVKPGERAVVLTANPEGDKAVEALRGAGVTVVRVVDARKGEGIIRAVGKKHVESVVLTDGTSVAADLLVTSVGWTAPTSLINMAGDKPVWSATANRFLPSGTLPPEVLATGGLAGDGTLDELIAHGRATGTVAATRAAGAAAADPAPLGLDEHPALFRSTTHGFIDFTEDVWSKDIFAAVHEGYDNVELAKRFTTSTMGPSQGKLELVNTVAVMGEATGQAIPEVGTTTWRPPYAPPTLGALAGTIFEPVRVSPMHGWHVSHGAEPLIAGQWIRPDNYGDPAAEVRAVREAVAIIDVTPLGKLDLRGPDVPKLLNMVYVNAWNKLDIGSVRYGVMCAEDGVVMDDGVTGRLGENHYLMSTTSSGAATVWEWCENWLQTEHPEWQVHITPVTTAFASINIAGPKSRELMERVVDGVDLSNEAFPYMRVRVGRLAGVDGCVMWRIGFTGELSYEVHVPASYALHVWQTLLEVGADLGIKPFGIEAQRILRLEKGHFIVAQDTDGLTKAYSAGLGGLIKLDKPDFAGRSELAWQAEKLDTQPQLVAIETADGSVVPPEASQIVDGNRIVGRITSSRMSPTLGRSVCLGQVEAARAKAGTGLTIQLPSGTRVQAKVAENLAFVDPEGGRLRV